MLGYSFDWDRVIDTTDPNYYKWTQWIFLQLFKHGLAYKTTMPVNWCTSCKCVLANEEVVEGVCERCGAPVIRKEKSQWMLKITAYAQRLIDDLDDLDFIERVKIQQKNWIGRSTGAEVTFKATTGDDIVVYTTRPRHPVRRHLYGPRPRSTPYVESGWMRQADQRRRGAGLSGGGRLQVRPGAHRAEQGKDRRGAGRACGASTRSTARRSPSSSPTTSWPPTAPAPSWPFPPTTTVTGSSPRSSAVQIIEVVSGGEDVQKAAFTAKDETGILVNSGFLNGLTVKDAIPVITKWLEEKGIGHAKVNYKLRDWVFSRQRYWGEPIPMV